MLDVNKFHYALKRISNVNPIINYVLLLGQWTRDESFFKISQMFWRIGQIGQTKCGLFGALSDAISTKRIIIMI